MKMFTLLYVRNSFAFQMWADDIVLTDFEVDSKLAYTE